MACSVCGGSEVRSVNGNFFEGTSIRFLTHPIFGCEIVECSNCGLLEADHVHPAAVIAHYRHSAPGSSSRETDRVIGNGQASLWKNLGASENGKTLFHSVGRGHFGASFLTGANDVNEYELVKQTCLHANRHIGFFTPGAFRLLVERQGSFDIADLRTCGAPLDDVIAKRSLIHDFDRLDTLNGWVIRALLKNACPETAFSGIKDDPARSLESLSRYLYTLASGQATRGP